jgi:hypothetical protein
MKLFYHQFLRPGIPKAYGLGFPGKLIATDKNLSLSRHTPDREPYLALPFPAVRRAAQQPVAEPRNNTGRFHRVGIRPDKAVCIEPGAELASQRPSAHTPNSKPLAWGTR